MRALLDRARAGVADGLKSRVPLSARRRLVTLRISARERSATWRLLPDALVIGAQRAGTSSLYKYLGRHPDLAPAVRKETSYLSHRHPDGELWYRAHFPLAATRVARRAIGAGCITFEATPDYMLDPRAPKRAAALVPNARLVALLRDPVSRAYSHYNHMCRLDLESLSFRDALSAEEDRIGPDLAALAEDPEHPALMLRRYSYFWRGLYARHLEPWMDLYPSENLLVVFTRDLFGRPEPTFDAIVAHLGGRPWRPPSFDNHSYPTGGATAPEPMAPDLAEALGDRYVEADLRLATLLDRKLPWASDAG